MSLADRTLFLAGGGTGGHLIPALILAEEVRRQGGTPILVTGNRPVEDTILEGTHWERLPQRLEGGALRVGLGLARSFLGLGRHLGRRRAAAVVVLGGRVGLPVGLAAWIRRIPLFLVEINGVPGRTTRLLAPLARRVFLGHEAAASAWGGRRTVVTGVPLKPGFLPLPGRREAVAALGWDGWEGRVLLVFGGSMGARDLNRAVLDHLARPGVLPPDVRVVHITGTAMADQAREAWREAGVTAAVHPFLAAMENPYAAADLVLCRGGAMTVAEVRAAGCPALIVPYPWHRDRHQEINAAPLVAQGQAEVVAQEALATELASRVTAGLARSAVGEPVRGAAVGAAAILDPLTALLAGSGKGGEPR